MQGQHRCRCEWLASPLLASSLSWLGSLIVPAPSHNCHVVGVPQLCQWSIVMVEVQLRSHMATLLS